MRTEIRSLTNLISSSRTYGPLSHSAHGRGCCYQSRRYLIVTYYHWIGVKRKKERLQQRWEMEAFCALPNL